MKSIMLNEDLSELTEDELRDQIAELQSLDTSRGWQLLERVLREIYAVCRDALVDASATDDRAALAIYQGKAQMLRAILRHPEDRTNISRFDDDESGIIDQMIKARRDQLGEETVWLHPDGRRTHGRTSGSDELAVGGDGRTDLSEPSLYRAEDAGGVVGNDSVPGSERGGRLVV